MTTRRTRASRCARTRRPSHPARRRAPRTIRARSRTSHRHWTQESCRLMAQRRRSQREFAGIRMPQPQGRLDRHANINLNPECGRFKWALTVHLDAALPLVLLFLVCASRLLRVLGLTLLGLAWRCRCGRRRRAPCWWQEVDEEVCKERKRGGVTLIAPVGGVRQELDDGDCEVVRRREDVCCIEDQSAMRGERRRYVCYGKVRC